MSLSLDKGIPIAVAYEKDTFKNIIYVDYDVPIPLRDTKVTVANDLGISYFF